MAFPKRITVLLAISIVCVIAVVAVTRHGSSSAVATSATNIDACDRNAQQAAGLSDAAQRELADKCFRSGTFTKSQKKEW